MTRIVKIYRGLSGSTYVYFSSEQPPSGLTQTTLISQKVVEDSFDVNLFSPVEVWTLDGVSGLTGSFSGGLITVANGTLQFGPGPREKSLSVYVDGNDRLTAAVSSAYQITQPMTTTCLIYPINIASADSYPMSMGNTEGSEANNVLYSFVLQTDNNLATYYESGSAETDITVAASTYSITHGTWNHLATTRTSDGFVKLYHNGVLVTSASSGLATGGTNAALSIGGFHGGVNYFTGLISTIKIFDKVLSEDEVRADAANSLDG